MDEETKQKIKALQIQVYIIGAVLILFLAFFIWWVNAIEKDLGD